MNLKKHRLSIRNVEDAVKIIDSIFLNSPQFECESLNKALGLNLIIKNEIENPVKCFKARASEIFISKAKPGSHIICASAGNFGQAMAYSAKKKDIDLTIYTNKNANVSKIE